MDRSYVLKESKVFDPHDPATEAYGNDLIDCSIAARDACWWMVLAGQPGGYGATDLFSAKLPPGAALSANGWTTLRDTAGK